MVSMYRYALLSLSALSCVTGRNLHTVNHNGLSARHGADINESVYLADDGTIPASSSRIGSSDRSSTPKASNTSSSTSQSHTSTATSSDAGQHSGDAEDLANNGVFDIGYSTITMLDIPTTHTAYRAAAQEAEEENTNNGFWNNVAAGPVLFDTPQDVPLSSPVDGQELDDLIPVATMPAEPESTVKCSYEEVNDVANGQYIQHASISCSTTLPVNTSSPVASKTSTSASSSTSSSSKSPSTTTSQANSTTSKPDPIKAALDWLTGASDSTTTSSVGTKSSTTTTDLPMFSSSTSTETETEHETHTSIAAANRLRLIPR